MNEELTFVLSLAGLIAASFLIGDGGERISRSLGHSFAGGVILGLMTALPETVLVVSALAVGLPEAAFSSVAGANAMLMTLGLGLLGLVYLGLHRRPITMEGEYLKEVRSLLVSTLIALAYLVLYSLFNEDLIRYVFGVSLVAVYVHYVYSSYSESRARKEGGVNLMGLTMVIIGGAIAVLLSPVFLESLEVVSIKANIPYLLMVYLLTPIAAELEEKLSSYLLILKSPNNGSLALYSFVGSKIQNASFLVGLVILFSDVVSTPYLAVLLASNLFAAFVLKDGKLTLLESVLGLGLYIAFSAILSSYSAISAR